ncbi:unnamed protein product, partial [Ixodes hexagonus]
RLSTRRRDGTRRGEPARSGRPDAPEAAVIPRWLALAVPWYTLAAPPTSAAPSHAVADAAAAGPRDPSGRSRWTCGNWTRRKSTPTGPRLDSSTFAAAAGHCRTVGGHLRTPPELVRTLEARDQPACLLAHLQAWTAAAAAALAARRLWWTSACAAGGVINGDLAAGGGGGPQGAGHALPAPPQSLPWLPDMK